MTEAVRVKQEEERDTGGASFKLPGPVSRGGDSFRRFREFLHEVRVEMKSVTATPRHKDYGAMTLFTQVRYHVTIAHVISPRCFWPAPNVESAVVALDRRDPRVTLEPGAPFHDLVRAGFGHRRKMLRKLLSGFDGAEKAFESLDIPTNARAEELSLDQWIRLANAVAGS